MAGHSSLPCADCVNLSAPGHPRLYRCLRKKTWMPGTNPGMTKDGIAKMTTPARHLQTPPAPVCAAQPFCRPRFRGRHLLRRDRPDQLRVVIDDAIDPRRDIVPGELALAGRGQQRH